MDCEKLKEKQSNLVRFMMEEIAKSKCKIKPEQIICTPCSSRAGGFAPDFGIILCDNQILSKSHFEDTFTHELIHLYDHCTMNVDWNNPEHVACSEIRAATLSGDCKFTRELMRGHFAFAKQFQVCVKRRAILSLKENPKFAGPGIAKEAVNRVWDRCFNDKAPFDDIY